MKSGLTNTIKIGQYDIYARESPRGWAIIIMPTNIRIDTFHGYPHIHFSQKGKKHEIKIENFDTALKIIDNHIYKNITINKKRLLEELL
ncbi:hypothetical protein [Methanobrevibacter curvatus]|uniref:Uncharacterized protein n=1 Tax=Methanobrevibacter curvatus TaxID=49547 RepID=A0A166AN67_9EURY|nr:hypothetical protein [Methanobrevibacter curvatus]KZX12254.1 hypothetical protein MBCUR_11060 [Methanobrevibacter curvatus]